MVYSTNADEVDAELATVTAEITALDANIATLPEGELKREQVKKKKKAELKQFLLTEKQHDYGVVALLNKEFDPLSVASNLRTRRKALPTPFLNS